MITVTLRLLIALMNPIGSAILIALAFDPQVVEAQTKGSGTESAPYEFSESNTLTHSEPIVLNAGQSIFLQLDRNGGTGFYWEPIIEDRKVLQIEFVRTVSLKKKNELAVGRPEADVFRVIGRSPGMTIVSFNLTRVRSSPVTAVRLGFSVINNK
jgi:predicted secreted protein